MGTSELVLLKAGGGVTLEAFELLQTELIHSGITDSDSHRAQQELDSSSMQAVPLKTEVWRALKLVLC
jgi:hypothetical protein